MKIHEDRSHMNIYFQDSEIYLPKLNYICKNCF